MHISISKIKSDHEIMDDNNFIKDIWLLNTGIYRMEKL